MRGSRWLIFAPALFASALLDPEIFSAFIHTGKGGGSLMVVLTALSSGFVLSRRRWSIAAAACALVALLGLLLLGFIGTMAAPLSTARGAWVCLYGLTLVMLLCLASVLPYRPVRPPRGAASWAALGALGGLGLGLRPAQLHGGGRGRRLRGRLGPHLRVHPVARRGHRRPARLGGVPASSP